MFTQNKEQFHDNPLNDSGFTPASSHTSSTRGTNNATHDQFDPNLVQVLAQEMIKLMKGKQGEQSYDNQQSFAHFSGTTSVISNSYAAHSRSWICYAT